MSILVETHPADLLDNVRHMESLLKGSENNTSLAEFPDFFRGIPLESEPYTKLIDITVPLEEDGVISTIEARVRDKMTIIEKTDAEGNTYKDWLTVASYCLLPRENGGGVVDVERLPYIDTNAKIAGLVLDGTIGPEVRIGRKAAVATNGVVTGKSNLHDNARITVDASADGVTMYNYSILTGIAQAKDSVLYSKAHISDSAIVQNSAVGGEVKGYTQVSDSVVSERSVVAGASKLRACKVLFSHIYGTPELRETDIIGMSIYHDCAKAAPTPSETAAAAFQAECACGKLVLGTMIEVVDEAIVADFGINHLAPR